MNLTYLQELPVNITDNDLSMTGLINGTTPFTANITGKIDTSTHLIISQELVGLGIVGVMFIIGIFVLLAMYIFYQISNKRRGF